MHTLDVALALAMGWVLVEDVAMALATGWVLVEDAGRDEAPATPDVHTGVAEVGGSRSCSTSGARTVESGVTLPSSLSVTTETVTHGL